MHFFQVSFCCVAFVSLSKWSRSCTKLQLMYLILTVLKVYPKKFTAFKNKVVVQMVKLAIVNSYIDRCT